MELAQALPSFDIWSWDFWLLVTIPLSSGIVGWGTNWVAIKMTFYPIEYLGVRPFGWQGIIPANGKKMAEKSVELLTRTLLRIDERFSMIDPQRVAQEMEIPLAELTRRLVDEVMLAQFAAIWPRLPQGVRDRVYLAIEAKTPQVVADMMQDLKEEIEQLVDLKLISIEALVEDKYLLNHIFQTVGKKEFRFIEVSGFYFGFLFGLPQFFYCAIYGTPWWFLPLMGLLVGYLTNWLALKMIFEPRNPIRLFGYTIQGLFLKRQHEVAEEYAAIVSSRILPTEKLFEYIMRGPGSPRMNELVQMHLNRVADEALGQLRQWISQSDRIDRKYESIKKIAAFRLSQELPVAITAILPYAQEALNIEGSMRDKMRLLTPAEFEGFLRPAFQEDELTLIIVGAVLGLLTGIAQYFFLFT